MFKKEKTDNTINILDLRRFNKNEEKYVDKVINLTSIFREKKNKIFRFRQNKAIGSALKGGVFMEQKSKQNQTNQPGEQHKETQQR